MMYCNWIWGRNEVVRNGYGNFFLRGKGSDDFFRLLQVVKVRNLIDLFYLYFVSIRYCNNIILEVE